MAAIGSCREEAARKESVGSSWQGVIRALHFEHVHSSTLDLVVGLCSLMLAHLNILELRGGHHINFMALVHGI